MTREELKAHCEKQVELCEMWAISRGEKPSGKIYEEHKLILELLEQEPTNCTINGLDDFIDFGKKAFGVELTIKKSDNPDTYVKLFGTTKNDLRVDCVSRQEVDRLACRYLTKATDENIAFYEHFLDLPSVTPQKPRWIPVSERLPEEDTDVFVTLKCGLIGIMQKKLADDDNGEPCYIWQDFEGEEHEVLAWMPLPEAYKENEDEN